MVQKQPETFGILVGAVLRRFFAQNGEVTPDVGEIEGFTARLWTLVSERGLPQPLAAGEMGAPGELPEAECSSLTSRALAGAASPLLAEAARQLVKACFYPEFKTCRDSFCAVAGDGSCRRQELARVRKRISGTHCVDCPYWIGLQAEPHGDFLRRHWRGDVALFAQHRGAFLPEDFRALRQWLHAKAREAR